MSFCKDLHDYVTRSADGRKRTSQVPFRLQTLSRESRNKGLQTCFLVKKVRTQAVQLGHML